MTNQAPVRIYVGTDRSQLIGAKILDYSIRRRTALEVVTQPMHELALPQPKTAKHHSRTGFSFARFAIPELAGRQGRAIYMDADMLVFKDIAELWGFPFDGAKVVCQEEPPVRGQKRRRKQCSVMLLDCEALDWDVNKIVSGLDGLYDYHELMSELCILDETEVSYALPSVWNSLEHFDEETRLIHYTDMLNQPWVCASNKNGHLWVQELRDALADGVVTMDELKGEIALGFARPSLINDLQDPEKPLSKERIRRLEAIDRDAGFEPHRTLVESLSAQGAGGLKDTAKRALHGMRRLFAGA